MSSDLSIVMLSWKSPVTTRYTLGTYTSAGLPACCGEFFVFYNQYSPQDKALCDELGVRSCGVPENIGIWGAQKNILAAVKNDYVLFLQNDHPVIVSHEEMEKWIDGGMELLRNGRADIVYLRHRNNLGAGYGFGWKPFQYYYVRELNPAFAEYMTQASDIPKDYDRDTFMRRLRRFLRPTKAVRRSISALYLEKHPERVLPKHIRREGDFLIVDSSILNFSESPFLVSRAFYERISSWAEKHPRHRTVVGFQNLEPILNCRWWRDQNFRIATCDGGVFGHERRDDSWRPNTSLFNPELLNGSKKARS